jgi:O-6-methylguanine DNA methyltransferase
VRTYGWVAEQIGNPKAARAVGNALNKNPFPVVVPCHRVVAKNGLGGFSRGIKVKKRILRSEGYKC